MFNLNKPRLGALSPAKGDVFKHEDIVVRIDSREIAGFYVCTVLESESFHYYIGQKVDLHKDTLVEIV